MAGLKALDSGHHLVFGNSDTFKKLSKGAPNADGAAGWALLGGRSGVINIDEASPELIAHEIGHMAGIDHDDDEKSMMNETLNGPNHKWTTKHCEDLRKKLAS